MTHQQVTKIHWTCDRCSTREVVETELDPSDERAFPPSWAMFEWTNSRTRDKKKSHICHKCNDAACDFMHGKKVQGEA